MDLGEAVTETSPPDRAEVLLRPAEEASAQHRMRGPERRASPHRSSLRADAFSSEREEEGRSLAIGVGFRKRCTADDLQGVIGEALALLADLHPTFAGASAVLATIAEKDRPALHAVAGAIGLPVVILPKAALRGTEGRITVTSDVARACLGIPSVAEAAALAAAGAGSRLLVNRIASPFATCAIACGAEPEAA